MAKLIGTSYKIDDLGVLDQTVLLFGGPYSNFHATTALFDRADAMHVDRTARICTGDVAGYCADPLKTWREVGTRGGPVVAGNVERQIAAGGDDCDCGFETGSVCQTLSQGWFPYSQAAFGAGEVAVMAELPDVVVFSHFGRRYAVIHGGLSDVSKFLWPVSDEADFEREIRLIEAAVGPVDVVIGGHCGVGFTRQIGTHLWINAGAIGLPPNDGKATTRFLTLSGGQPRFHQLAYDQQAAATAIEASELANDYASALRSGYWPSEEILPHALRRAA